MDAPLGTYLAIAHKLYMEDRLDAAMEVVLEAFERAGWPPGLWTEFYNALTCEKDARDAAVLHKVDAKLSIELDRAAPLVAYEDLKAVALDVRKKIGELLRVQYVRPVMITVFLPDAPIDFIVGSHGYVSHKIHLDKICVPRDCIPSHRSTVETLMHEFTHVAAYELAGDDLPRWMDEGLATYLCGDTESRDCRFLIRASTRTGRLLLSSRIERVLQSPDLYKDDPNRVQAAYCLSGSLISWWAGRRGLESVRDVLVRIGSGEGLERAVRAVLRVPLRDIERDWRRELQAAR